MLEPRPMRWSGETSRSRSLMGFRVITYEPEARTTLPRLRTCESSTDVLRVVHEELSRWVCPHRCSNLAIVASSTNVGRREGA